MNLTSVPKHLFSYYGKLARARRIKSLKGAIAPYLQKDFGVELNYKMWTTKGARFGASHRTKIQNDLSSKTVGYLSAYLTIVSLVGVYKIPTDIIINDNYLGFILTGLSILILIFSQFETSNNYGIKSEKFHQCALEIGKLYDALRIIKTFESVTEKEDLIKKIARKYERVLDKYENHEPIDFEYFKTTKPDYFKLSWLKRMRLEVKFYFTVKFKYHIFIYGPAILIVSILLAKRIVTIP